MPTSELDNVAVSTLQDTPLSQKSISGGTATKRHTMFYDFTTELHHTGCKKILFLTLVNVQELCSQNHNHFVAQTQHYKSVLNVQVT